MYRGQFFCQGNFGWTQVNIRRFDTPRHLQGAHMMQEQEPSEGVYQQYSFSNSTEATGYVPVHPHSEQSEYLIFPNTMVRLRPSFRQPPASITPTAGTRLGAPAYKHLLRISATFLVGMCSKESLCGIISSIYRLVTHGHAALLRVRTLKGAPASSM